MGAESDFTPAVIAKELFEYIEYALFLYRLRKNYGF